MATKRRKRAAKKDDVPQPKYKERIKDVRKVEAGKLQAFAGNWRTHPQQQREALEKVLGEVGNAGVLLAYEKEDGTLELIDGHLRQSLQDDPKAQVWVAVTDLTAEEAQALNLVYDPISALAGVDGGLLAQAMQAAPAWTFEQEGIGGLLAQLAIDNPAPLPESETHEAEDASGQEEEAQTAEGPTAQELRRAELIAKYGVKRGQVWCVGGNIVACGDSQNPLLLDAVLQGGKASLLLTDPPYNVGEKTKNYGNGLRADSYDKLAASQWDKGFDWVQSAAAFLPYLADNACALVFHAEFTAAQVWGWMEQHFAHHNYLVWVKPNPMPSLAKRHWCHGTELIGYGARKGHTFNYPKAGHALNWLQFSAVQHNRIHPTQKPVELICALLERHIDAKTVVLDPFLGSGTTAVACSMYGVPCAGIEADAGYFAAALQRLEDALQETPKLLQEVQSNDEEEAK